MPATVFEKEAELIAAEAALKSRLSPVVPGVYQCIVQVSGELAKDGISKTRINDQQGYKFRGIDDVHNALAPVLAKHGLVILPRCLSRNVVERQTQKGGTLFYVTVEAEFDFVCAADGSTHTVRMYGEAMDSADKATNKAMSAAYKYAAFLTFCIPTEGEDADAETHEVAAAPTPMTVATPVAGQRGGATRPLGTGEISSSERVTPSAVPGKTRGPSLPPGAVYIVSVDSTKTKNPKVTKYLITTSAGETYSTIKDRWAAQARTFHDDHEPVLIEGEKTKWGLELTSLVAAGELEAAAPVEADEIPF
jgi:hypothetical protein